jgi:hypothetical protein
MNGWTRVIQAAFVMYSPQYVERSIIVHIRCIFAKDYPDHRTVQPSASGGILQCFKQYQLEPTNQYSDNPNFGRILTSASARQIQVAMKLIW